MNKIIILTSIALLWIASLIVLIIALTNVIGDNPFQEHRLIVGISFFVLSRILITIYKKTIKMA